MKTSTTSILRCRLIVLLCMGLLLVGTAVPGGVSLIRANQVVPAAAGDEYWDTRFGPPGVSESIWECDDVACAVTAFAQDGRGNLYVGGRFSAAGGVGVNNIARWDGSQWATLGSGLESSVSALLVDRRGYLIAGGYFSMAGGRSIKAIAQWDGTTWSALGSGLEEVGATSVTALAMDAQGNIYAGGSFTSAGGVPAANIARWDGTTWSALGAGLTGIGDQVKALAFDAQGNLYAGGTFTAAGGVVASNIARWDGTRWWPLGDGIRHHSFPPTVAALTFDRQGNLYAGGTFTSAGGVAASNIARWDGTTWTAVARGMSYVGAHADVFALAFDSSGRLVAGGLFTTVDGVAAKNIARWDGSRWAPLGGEFNWFVDALAFDGLGRLYAGGGFSAAGGAVAARIALWDGTRWSPLLTPEHHGLNSLVEALAVDAGGVYAAGEFTTAGTTYANKIARWNGSAWAPLGGGFIGNRKVYALAADQRGNLYAGGWFFEAGGVPARFIARWDGTTWAPLGSGMHSDAPPYYEGTVVALAVDSKGNLYAAGAFTTAGGVPAHHIARWDGTSWSPLGSGLDLSAFALAVDHEDNLYAAGNFTTAGGVSANNIARWDGTRWWPVGSGTNGRVLALAVDRRNNLYAGGEFTVAGGVQAERIARWDGTTWAPLGSGVGGVTWETPFVRALAVDDSDNLYAAGIFTTAGGIPALHSARWNGSTWAPLGSGLGGILALAAHGSNVYAGGGFTRIGGTYYGEHKRGAPPEQPSFYFARWSDAPAGDAPVVPAPDLRRRLFLPRVDR